MSQKNKRDRGPLPTRSDPDQVFITQGDPLKIIDDDPEPITRFTTIELIELGDIIEEEVQQPIVETVAKQVGGTCPVCGHFYALETVGNQVKCINCGKGVELK